VLGRLALKKVPLEAVSVAPKNNDHLKEVEKDEYPTHLSVRITLFLPRIALFCCVITSPFPDSHSSSYMLNNISFKYVIAIVHVLSYYCCHSFLNLLLLLLLLFH
jgi:hypothetical protein